MRNFVFDEEDMRRVVDDPRFLDLLNFGLSEAFYIDESIPNKEFYEHCISKFDNRELTYCGLSFVDSKKVLEEGIPLPSLTPLSERDEIDKIRVDTVLQVLGNNTSARYNPAFWAILGMCDMIAIFVVFPIARLLFPEIKLYVVQCSGHVVVSNSEDLDDDKTIIFDLIAQYYDVDESLLVPRLVIPEESIPQWYLETYGDKEYSKKIKELKTLFENLNQRR